MAPDPNLTAKPTLEDLLPLRNANHDLDPWRRERLRAQCHQQLDRISSEQNAQAFSFFRRYGETTLVLSCSLIYLIWAWTICKSILVASGS
jgi:hypothetical protein